MLLKVSESRPGKDPVKAGFHVTDSALEQKDGLDGRSRPEAVLFPEALLFVLMT